MTWVVAFVVWFVSAVFLLLVLVIVCAVLDHWNDRRVARSIAKWEEENYR